MTKLKTSGPKSTAGKAIASVNAFKHGLTSQKWLDGEHEDYFKKILGSLTDEYLPQTPTEILMVERVAVTMTKARRLNTIEDAQYQLAKALVAQRLRDGIPRHMHDVLRPIDGDSVQNQAALKLQQDASMPTLEAMNIINRQQNSLSRQLSKELSELITIINLRKNQKSHENQKPEIEGPEEAEWDYE
jgi:hypothetical protein